MSGIGPGGSGGGIAGTDYAISAAATWDPDGAGPEPTKVVISGAFTIAGDVVASDLIPTGYGWGGLAAWDGERWSAIPLPARLPVQPSLNLLGSHGNLLVCTAYISGGFRILTFDGTAWRTLDESLDGLPVCVTSLGVDLVLAGRFSHVGSLAAAGIARWDGSAWHAMGSGLSDGYVDTVTLHNGRVVAGGTFLHSGQASTSRVAAWNGNSWEALGSGVGAECTSLASAGGQLFATSAVAGTSGILIWNGQTWTSPAAPAGTPARATPLQRLTVHQGSVWSSGRFYYNGSSYAMLLVRWNGSQWEVTDPHLPIWDNPFLLASRGNELLAMLQGRAPTSSYFEPVRPVRRWDGTAWKPAGQGFDGLVERVIPLGSGRYMACGTFTCVGGNFVNGVALWNGSAWEPMDAGLPAAVSNTNRGWDIGGAAMYQGHPVIVGSFASIGGDPLSRGAAQWDGTSWIPLGGRSAFGGKGLGATTLGGQLAVASGGSNVAEIRLFDGTNWSAIPGLLTGFAPYSSTEQIRMIEFDGSLVVAGAFTAAGGVSAGNVARWDGQAWLSMSSGPTSAIGHAFVVHQSQLYSGGYGYAARWNGTSWDGLPMGTLSSGSDIRSLLSHDGGLWAGTDYGLRRWDSQLWRPVGGGQLFPAAYSLVEDGPDVLVAGAFATVADGRVVAGLSRWSSTPRPPVVTVTATGPVAAPTLRPTWIPMTYTGTGPYVVDRVMKNGVEVPLTAVPMGGARYLAASPYGGFEISNPIPQDAGDYQLVVSNACGSATSDVVRVNVVCSADFDADGRVDIADLFSFLRAWFANDPRANFNNYGSGTIGVLLFVETWLSGC